MAAQRNVNTIAGKEHVLLRALQHGAHTRFLLFVMTVKRFILLHSYGSVLPCRKYVSELF